MTGRTQAFVLLVVGLVVIRLACGPDLTTYVRPGARPLVLAGGATVTAIALLGLRRHAGPGSRPVWLVLGLVAVLTLVNPPPLGLPSASRPPASPPRPDHGFAAVPASGVVSLRVGDLVLRTVWGDGTALRGRSVRVTGFVARTTAGGFVLARLVITCCAADAEPYDVEVETGAGGPLRPPPQRVGTWLQVTGRYAGHVRGAPNVPLLRDARSTPVAPPAAPYE